MTFRVGFKYYPSPEKARELPAELARGPKRPTSAQGAGTPPYLSSTLRMASYDDGSGAAAGGEVTGSTEMELQELVVDFTEDGRILLEVKGVKGPECRAITEDLIKALGDVITTENTEEYFQEKIVNVQQDPVQLGWSYDSNKPQW
eukprot:g10150.t1